MTDKYQTVGLDSARETETNTTEAYDNDTNSHNNSDESLTSKNVLVKLKFTNGTVLKVPRTEKKAETCTIAELKNDQFSKEERANLKLICKGEELQDDERVLDQVIVLDGEKEKSEHVVTIHAVLPALAMTGESPVLIARPRQKNRLPLINLMSR